MRCPRCGERNDEGTRFCGRCGEKLRAEAANSEGGETRSPFRGLGRRIVGSSRKERLLTAGTVVGIAVAIWAITALPNDEGSEVDPYVSEADAICTEAKQASLEVSAQFAKKQTGGPEPLAAYGRGLARLVAETRSRLASLQPPPAKRQAAADLDAALRELGAAMQGFVLAADRNSDKVPDKVARTGRVGDRVEAAIAALGLERCTRVPLVAPTGPG